MLLLFETLDKAANAAQLDRRWPGACDLMDRRHLSLARESDPRYELLIPGEAEAVLLVELHGDSREEVAGQARRSGRSGSSQLEAGRAGARWPKWKAETNCFGSLARRFVPTLYRLQGSTRPVPSGRYRRAAGGTAVFLRRLQDTLKRHQVTASLFGHAGHGQLHIRPFLDLANPDEVAKMESLAERLYEKVWHVGGTISGEHGDGLSRTPFLPRNTARS